VLKAPVRLEGHVLETLSSTSAPKYVFTFASYFIPNVSPPSVGYHLRHCEPVPNPHSSFLSHSIFLISSLSKPLAMITMTVFTDSSSTCSGQRSRCRRRSKSAGMLPAQVKLSFMDLMTPDMFHHLSTSLYHRQWPAARMPIISARHSHFPELNPGIVQEFCPDPACGSWSQRRDERRLCTCPSWSQPGPQSSPHCRERDGPWSTFGVRGGGRGFYII
jgi:hypothetical protein